MFPKNKGILEKAYKKIGSTRFVAKKFKCSQATVVYWLRKFNIPAIPTKLHVRGGNTGKGRLTELYFNNIPRFKKRIEDALTVFGDKAHYDSLLRNKKINWKSSHYKRPIFRIKAKKHKCDFYGLAWYDDNISRVLPRKKWIIPAGIVPRTTLTIGLRNSKYNKFLLPSVQGDKNFNISFGNKYSKFLPRRKDGQGNVRSSFLVGKKTATGGSNFMMSRHRKTWKLMPDVSAASEIVDGNINKAKYKGDSHSPLPSRLPLNETFWTDRER